MTSKKEPQPGDKVEIKTKDDLYRGILMERSKLADDKHLVIKLKSGYNIGLKKDEIKEINVIQKRKKKEDKKDKKSVKVDENKPIVSIISNLITAFPLPAAYCSNIPFPTLSPVSTLYSTVNFNSRISSLGIIGTWVSDLLQSIDITLLAL